MCSWPNLMKKVTEAFKVLCEFFSRSSGTCFFSNLVRKNTVFESGGANQI